MATLKEFIKKVESLLEQIDDQQLREYLYDDRIIISGDDTVTFNYADEVRRAIEEGIE
jgi:hypothetical protein